MNDPRELLRDSPDWRAYDRDALLRQYSPSLDIGVDLEARAQLVQGWEHAFRSKYRVVADIRYGESARQCIDLILPHDVVEPALHIFVHGGYWRRGDRMGHGRCAQTFLAAGFAGAIVGFDLCPAVTIGEQVAQVREAIAFLWRNAPRLGFRRGDFDLGGHSTGAHLAAMALTTDWPACFGDVPMDVIRSATLVSGLFDLAPVATLPHGQGVGLDDERRIREWSPVLLTPFSGLRVLVAAGERESREFQRQSALLAQTWKDKTAACRFGVIADCDHINILEDIQSGRLGSLAVRNAAAFRRCVDFP